MFCGDCEVTVLPLEAACPGCAMPQAACAELCQACRLRPFPFRQAMAALLYGGAVAEALVRFKHGSQLAPARPLGRCLVPLLDWGALHGVDAVLPVPLHPARLRARGFNQSLELIREANAHRARPAARAPAAGLDRRPCPHRATLRRWARNRRPFAAAGWPARSAADPRAGEGAGACW